MQDLLKRQLKLEQESYELSYERLLKQVNSRIEAGEADELKEGRVILLHSIDLVSDKLRDYFKADLRGRTASDRQMLINEFGEDTKQLAYIIMTVIVRSISKEMFIPVTSLLQKLGNTIHESILVKRLEEAKTTHAAFVDRRYEKRTEAFRRRQKIKMAKNQDALASKDLNKEVVRLTGILLDVVIKSGCDILEIKTVWQKGKSTKMAYYTDTCLQMVIQSRDIMLNEYRKYPILLIKPQDWERFDGSGGYYMEELYKIPIIKTRQRSKKLLRDFLKVKGNDALFEVLNSLQATKWSINKRVYDVMSYVFNENLLDPESAYGNPYLVGKLPYNESQEPEDYVNITSFGEIDQETKRLVNNKDYVRYRKEIDAQQDIINSNRGKALMLNLVLSNAREYYDEEEFYFSYQYDFRGRIYPIQQHLQPQGGSATKALLQFKEGVRIEDQEQEDWFLIHGANCYGYDKDEYVDRIRKIKQKEEEIKLVAEDPIGNRNYWKDADEPYLYLAWCLEYAEYLENPKTFVSHLAVALDATCSGIQIYSGLLRDKTGSLAVNVIGNKRNDIYQEVADKVNRYLEAGEYPKVIDYNTSDGVKRQTDTVATANSLKGKITRKLTKRNTMTVPYSVTEYGMFEQLKAELNDLENNNKKFWVGENWVVAKLLTVLNDRAITETVKGARIGQNYLKDVTADIISRDEWVFYQTPLTGFPVLQKIHRTKADRVNTPIGKLSYKTTLSQLDKPKMINGIAPNFIHSLDATLLAQTVLKLNYDGCRSYHLIHDSYGVPVNQVPNLNKRVRESFVELFKTNPLQTFVNDTNPLYENKPCDIMVGDLDLDDVLQSSYIFS